MAISGNLDINVGLPNESKGSDSLYTAFKKINTNFNTLFANASKVVAGNGIKVTNNLSNTVIEANLVAGNNIVLTTANGAITIEAVGGGGNGGGNINGVLAGNGLTGGGYSGNVTLSLANSNVAAGVYSNPVITVDQYGRIISAANNLVSGTVTSVAVTGGGGIQVSGSPITSNGTITVTNTGVLNLLAGTGVTLSGSNGNVTISLSGGGGGGGSVTSVGITSNTGLVISGSPIISSGNIGVNLPNNLSIVGNVTATRFVGNGSGLTGITVAAANVTGLGNIATYNLDGNASNVLHGDGTWSADVTDYSNSNVASYLPIYTGNLKAGNANLGNATISNYFIGNFYGTANSASSATTAGTVTTAAQPNITSVGTLSSLTITGNLSAGNANLGNLIKGNFFQGDGGLLTNISVAAGSQIISGNSNVSVAANSNVTVGVAGNANILVVTGTGANITGTLNATGNANVGNLGAATIIATTANLTTVNSGLLQNGNSNVSITSNGNISLNAVGGAAELLLTSTGANITGTLNISGNANAGNIGATQGVFTNVSGNGSALSSLTGANVSGQVSFAATANSVAGANVSGQVGNALVAGTVYTNAQPNITSVGTLSSLAVTGNVTAGNVYANSGTIGSNVIVANTISGSLTTNAQPNITSVGLLASLSVAGNIGANNVNLDGVLKTTVLLYSELPSAVTIGAGSRSFISDGNLVASGNFGAIVSGGASNNVPVYSDGTNWRIG